MLVGNQLELSLNRPLFARRPAPSSIGPFSIADRNFSFDVRHLHTQHGPSYVIIVNVFSLFTFMLFILDILPDRHELGRFMEVLPVSYF